LVRNKKYNIQLSVIKKLIHLNKIHGINFTRTKRIAAACGFSDIYSSTKTSKFLGFVDYYYDLEKNKIFNNILTKRTVKNYQGMRHILKLPVRGQRTHTNAKTIRRYVKREV
jgi:small subunit ribosomal protein S13